MNDPAAAKKQRVANAALAYLEDRMVLGVGTGSTVNALIDALSASGWARRLRGAVPSSERTASRLAAAGIPVLDLNDLPGVPLYLDGADEATRARHLIKGGGAALTREKIVAASAERFVCLIDEGKLVESLGRFPLPLEVIPMARGYVARRVAQIGGQPQWRRGVTTDNGNHILDVHGLAIDDPVTLEQQIERITGVVTVGLFAARPADLLLVASDRDVELI